MRRIRERFHRKLWLFAVTGSCLSRHQRREATPTTLANVERAKRILTLCDESLSKRSGSPRRSRTRSSVLRWRLLSHFCPDVSREIFLELLCGSTHHKCDDTCLVYDCYVLDKSASFESKDAGSSTSLCCCPSESYSSEFSGPQQAEARPE